MHTVNAETSFGAAKKILNKALHREGDEDAFALSTLGDYERRENASMDESVCNATCSILEKWGFDYSTGQLVDPEKLNGFLSLHGYAEPTPIDGTSIMTCMSAALGKGVKLNIGKALDDSFASTVSISIDEVLSKHQKEERVTAAMKQQALDSGVQSISSKTSCGSEYDEGRQRFVSNACVCIQVPRFKPYYITAPTVDEALKRVLAFLLVTGFIGRKLVFFTDGAKNLQLAIDRLFSFVEHKLIIDWYHIAKRCSQLLSQAFTGLISQKRGLKRRFLCFIWHGDIDGILALLCAIKSQDKQKIIELLYPDHQADSSDDKEKLYIPKVKNEAKLTEFINYLGNKESLMTCYSVRAYLKCKVSSNMAEKANDILVAHRQKKKAMSWSQDGSSGMATLKAFMKNGDLNNWILHRKFQFRANPCLPCANYQADMGCAA